MLHVDDYLSGGNLGACYNVFMGSTKTVGKDLMTFY